MQKIILSSVLLSVALGSFQLKAEEQSSFEISLINNPTLNKLGGEFSGHSKTTDGLLETEINSELSVKPIHTESFNGQGMENKVTLNPFGTFESKKFLNDSGHIRLFSHGKYEALSYSDDGIFGSKSLNLVDAGSGLGVQVDLPGNTKLSAHGGVGLGFEIGKRQGIFDPSVYAGSELNFNDILKISGDSEFRTSIFGLGNELANSAEASFRVTDNIRLGLELEKTQVLLGTGTKYDTDYVGVKIGGVFGKKNSASSK